MIARAGIPYSADWEWLLRTNSTNIWPGRPIFSSQSKCGHWQSV